MGTRQKPISVVGRVMIKIAVVITAMLIDIIPLTYLLTLVFPGPESAVASQRGDVWLKVWVMTVTVSGLYRIVRNRIK